MDFGLKGKVAMVAGASRGLGFAVARALAAEGVRVSLSSRNEQPIADAGKRIAAETSAETLAVAVDVRSAESLTSWHRQTIEKFGGLDLLFANSGGPPAGTALSFDDEAWKNAFELLVATMLSAQSTDARVNMVTPALFKRYPNASALAKATPAELEPQITIRRNENETVEEARVNGQLKWIKVTPRHGRPYFLIPDAGGRRYVRSDSLDYGLKVPMWLIFEF